MKLLVSEGMTHVWEVFFLAVMHLFYTLEMNIQTGFKTQLEMFRDTKQCEEATKTHCVPVTGH